MKGFTYRNHAIPDKLRGTYAGLGSPVAIEYLQSLGVTAAELLPEHHDVDERSLIDRGLKNYWGYNSIAFFAPNARFSISGVLGEQVREFKPMSKTCTPQASKSSSTSFTITPPRATTWGQRWVFAAQTTHHTTARRFQSALLHGLHRNREHG